ncbi:FAD-dependent oxidoreductase [Halioxenophilus sp. WMMB6]|uniref:FAD-dependent oxidoreductase n=1 Tax=Halioxenophilus sp. WMMB6 TaxID=3073815 RepID=UPI00295E66B4|nr:FAD-dependent oxidoreductase [Halioxenophilus sp. WMMB6]
MSETYDFIVVGSGAGSLCAALLMRDAGKSVLVLEKTDLVGGTTAVSGGVMWIPNNRYMKADGIADSPEQAMAYLNAIHSDDDGPGATQERRQAYVEEAPQMLEYLIGKGLTFRRVPTWPDYYPAEGESEAGRTVVSELFNLKELGEWQAKTRPGFLPLPAYLEEAMELPNMKRSWKSFKTLLKIIGRTLGTRLTGKHYATAGQALQGQLLLAATKAGVEIRTGAPVEQLVVDQGRVVGVVCDQTGAKQTLTAKLGVLLNAGGFAKNQRMLDQYVTGAKAEWSGVIESDTGDMIMEGMRIGASVAQMEERIGYPVTVLPNKPNTPTFMQGDLAKPHAILVDQSAQRYMKEAASYMQLSKGQLQHAKGAAAIPSWMIFDSQYITTYWLAGTTPGTKKPKEWSEAGFLKQGQTLAELAAACGLDASALTATVERFNGFVAQGKDEDFGRGDHIYDNWLGDNLAQGSHTLGAIEQAPFYAVPIYPGDVSTYGGLVTDVRARVLREDGSVIDGLYATGVTTASVMGGKAPGAGASIGPSITWGYIAAKHALTTAAGN